MARGLTLGGTLLVCGLEMLPRLHGTDTPAMPLAAFHLLPLLVAALQLNDGREVRIYAVLAWIAHLAMTWAMARPEPHALMALLEATLPFVPVAVGVWLGRQVRLSSIRARKMSLIDHLTGVGNRRDFETRLGDEIDRQQRYGGSFSLALIDLDDFKVINDSWGHAVGDQTLKSTAESIVRNTRRSDFVGRLDGDEFGVVMLNTSPDEAKRICNDILQTIEKRTQARGQGITASIGCITYARSPESVTRAMQQVDEVMYGVKRMGKGGVASV